jgi:hypothetical protein
MPGSDIRLIREGLCIYGHGPLERRDRYGWCEQCHGGYSLAGKVFTLHFELKSR